MLQTPPIEPTSLEKDRKDAYLFCAQAIQEKMERVAANGNRVDIDFHCRVLPLVQRVEKTMRDASQVPPTTVAVPVPLTEQPKLTEPVTQNLATTKVNGVGH